MFKRNFLHISLCLLPIILSVSTTEKSLALSSLPPCYLVHTSLVYLWGCYGSQYHLIVESIQVGQAWFPLHKSLLTSLSNLLVINMFTNVFQRYLFHHLPRDQSEANQPMVSQILPLAPLEDGEWHLFFYLSI